MKQVAGLLLVLRTHSARTVSVAHPPRVASGGRPPRAALHKKLWCPFSEASDSGTGKHTTKLNWGGVLFISSSLVQLYHRVPFSVILFKCHCVKFLYGYENTGKTSATFFSSETRGKKQFLIAESISKNYFQKTMLLQEREWCIFIFWVT